MGLKVSPGSGSLFHESSPLFYVVSSALKPGFSDSRTWKELCQPGAKDGSSQRCAGDQNKQSKRSKHHQPVTTNAGQRDKLCRLNLHRMPQTYAGPCSGLPWPRVRSHRSAWCSSGCEREAGTRVQHDVLSSNSFAVFIRRLGTR